jgi:hypothetical protein
MKRMAMWLLLPLLGWEGVPAAKAQAVLSGCTREALKDITEKYFAALEAHDPSGLPRASNVKFTENGVERAVGKGFWKTAGMTLLKRTLIDTVKCGTHTNAVMEERFSSKTVRSPIVYPGIKPQPLPAEGTTRPILFGVRLRVENQKISEIETIIAREGEYIFNANGVLATKNQDWDSILPPDQRSSRLAMIAAANDYFDMFAAEPRVNTPFATACDRWENGTHTTAGGLLTLAGEDGKTTEMLAQNCTPKGLVISNHGSRRFLVDEEEGLVVAFVHFAGSLPDCHVFRMRNGKVELINALVGAGSKSMGWPPEPVCRQ